MNKSEKMTKRFFEKLGFTVKPKHRFVGDPDLMCTKPREKSFHVEVKTTRSCALTEQQQIGIRACINNDEAVMLSIVDPENRKIDVYNLQPVYSNRKHKGKTKADFRDSVPRELKEKDLIKAKDLEEYNYDEAYSDESEYIYYCWKGAMCNMVRPFRPNEKPPKCCGEEMILRRKIDGMAPAEIVIQKRHFDGMGPHQDDTERGYYEKGILGVGYERTQHQQPHHEDKIPKSYNNRR